MALHASRAAAPMYEFMELGAAAREACNAIDNSYENAAVASHIDSILAILARD